MPSDEGLQSEPITAEIWIGEPPKGSRPRGPRLAPGDRVGAYRVAGVHAIGGMSELHRARHATTGERVMLKLALREAPAFGDWLAREAEILERAFHPHIVALRDCVEHDGELALALEALDGDDLGGLLEREGRLPPTTLVRWLEPLAAALDHLHSLGMVHGDIKPSNAMITGDGRPVWIDFGLARHVGDRCGVLAGTPCYMAPELLLAHPSDVGPAADRYGLAALALEALTGHRPYRSGPIGELFARMLDTEPRSPSELGVCSDELDRVFARAMAREPDARFETAIAFVSALESGLRDAQMQPLASSIYPASAPTVRALPPRRAA